MEEMQKIAKAVLTTALFDLIKIRSSKDFRYSGTPYIDKKDNFLFSKIEPKHIDTELLDWFQSDTREQYSYQYWLGYSGMNPNPIREYVEKLKAISSGVVMEDEKEIEVDRYAKEEIATYAKGFLNYARPNAKGKKWMNV